MRTTFQAWDESLFLFLNSFHSDFLDPFIFQATQTVTWIPFYAFLAFLIVRQFKMQSIWIFAAIGLSILFADQFTSAFMKPFFERLRPCHDPRWEGIVHNFGKCGGLYGFASSHASNSFAIAMLINLSLKGKYKFLPWLFLWATLFSYTRIYLGVHYPSDVIVGALVGIASAWLAFWIVMGFRLVLWPRLYSNVKKSEDHSE